MTSIIKVDNIQKANGSVPKASDLGINTTGSVLQVVQSRNNGATIATTSNTLIDTGISLSITPSSTSNKILITANFTGTSSTTNITGGTLYALYRNGTTNVFSGATNGNGMLQYNSSGSSYNHGVSQLSYLDSPSSASATTYGIYMSRVGSGTSSLQRDWGGVTMIAMEIAG